MPYTFNINSINNVTFDPSLIGNVDRTAGNLTFAGTVDAAGNTTGDITVNSELASNADNGAVGYLTRATIDPTVVEYFQLDTAGQPILNTPFGGVVVASNSLGFILEQLQGFAPVVNPVTGRYAGTFVNSTTAINPVFILFSYNISLNQFDAGGINPIPGVFPLPSTFQANVNVACFAPHTLIATPHGPRPVAAIAEGDTVLSADGIVRTVAFHGTRRVDCARHPSPEAVWPVEIAAFAFGDAPTRPLTLSPDHAVYADGVLIPIKHLIDGRGIAQRAADAVEYHHLELEVHDILLAEGLPAESYLETGQRAAFAGGDVTEAHPDFARRSREAEGCAPFVVAGPALDAVRARLAAIADQRDARAAVLRMLAA